MLSGKVVPLVSIALHPEHSRRSHLCSPGKMIKRDTANVAADHLIFDTFLRSNKLIQKNVFMDQSLIELRHSPGLLNKLF